MTEADAIEVFDEFLLKAEAQLGTPLVRVPLAPERLSRGWAFYYQSREYIETGDFSSMLLGQGPVVVTDAGELIEGGSLDSDPEQLLNR